VELAGTTSWQISVSEWDFPLEWALWVRAAERIEVPVGGVVTGPPDVDPLPAPSVPSGAPLAEGWLFWWRAVLSRPEPSSSAQDDLVELGRFGPPDFSGLDAYPDLQRIVAARWEEANAWHTARKRAGVAAFRSALARGGAGSRAEGVIVRSVEAEVGHAAAPFRLRIVVVPVLDDEIRSVDDGTFLVPERVRGTEAYTTWLRTLVRALA
jgi:hypothetical protein